MVEGISPARKKRILFVITGADTGGAQRHVIDLAGNLINRGLSAGVITGEHGPMTRSLDLLGAEVFIARNLVRPVNPLNDFMAIFEIGYYMKIFKPDIVSCHSSKAGVLGRLAATIFTDAPRVFTAHGLVFHDFMPLFKKWAYILAERFAGFFTDLLIAVSKHDLDKAIKYRLVSPERIMLIHNGIEPSSPCPSERTFPLPPQKIKLLAIGRLAFEKDYPTLIRSMRILEKESPGRFELSIVGDGSERNQLETMVSTMGLKSCIRFLGHREDIGKLMEESDVLVMSSIKEGFPYVILEAADRMLPIVATSAGGTGEFILDGNTGLLVPPAEPELLAFKLIALASDPALASRLARNARRKLEQEFTLRRMLERTIAAFEKAEKLYWRRKHVF